MITDIHMEKVACYKEAVNISPTNKISLIYGLNGSGKSTVSNYLYDLNNSKYSHCKIVEDSEHEILVYNQLFLSDYFYEEDSLKGIFTLSKENKKILESIDVENNNLHFLEEQHKDIEGKKLKITSQSEVAKNEVIEKIWEIKKKYAGGDRVLEYCFEGLKRKERLHEYLASVKTEETPEYTIRDLKKEVEELKGENVHRIDEIEEFLFGGYGTEESSVFEKIIVGSQEGSVAEFINSIGNSDWVRKGLGFLPEKIEPIGSPCPFCQEVTITDNLLTKIKCVFDDSYDRDIEFLQSYKSNYLELEGDVSFRSFDGITIFDKEISQRWKFLTDKIASNYRENKLLIDKKISSPSTSVKLIPNRESVSQLNSLILDINKLIRIFNNKLQNKQQSLNAIKTKFWLLMSSDYSQTIELSEKFISCLSSELKQEKLSLNNVNVEIIGVKGRIVELRKKTVNIEEAIGNINIGLSEIGALGFSVVKHGENLYRVQRSDDVGNAFHSLSEGEKTVISFLYFIELCKGQKTTESVPKKKVVVIDDPISSLSHIYVFNISQLIKRIIFNSSLFEQVFLLTHSLYFFYELTHTNKIKRDELQNLYRIVKNKNGSNVSKMKYEEIQNDYQTYWSIVKDDASPPALIANCMRNIIEYFFNFVQKIDFNNVFQKPVFSGDKFQAFSRYMNRESHSLGQNIFDIKEFDYSIFKEGLRLVFDECGYSDHYKVMAK